MNGNKEIAGDLLLKIKKKDWSDLLDEDVTYNKH